MVTSPLPSWESPMPSTKEISELATCQHREKNQKCAPGPHVGTVVTSPLPSRGPKCSAQGQKPEIAMWPTYGEMGKWANGLHEPCCLGPPQRPAWGHKAETATWPRCGQIGYITLAVSGVPNAQRRGKNQKCQPGPHVGKKVTSPLPFWGSPMLSAGPKIRIAYMPHMWAQ